MKKILVVAVVFALAGAAQAASVGFDFGTCFFKPSGAGGQTGNGSSFLINWNLENDLSLGVYAEQNPNVVLTVGAGTLTVSAIQVSKGVVKNVAVGLNLGSGAETLTVGPPIGSTASLVDIFGSVVILSGKGEKVEGTLKATVAARFCNTVTNMDGVNLGLVVGIGF